VARILFWSSSGFAGLYYPGDLLPVALLAWSIYILVYLAIRGGVGTSPSHAVRVGAAAICLLWLSYYANRPDLWNLSGFCILYAIPAIDALRLMTISLGRRRLTRVVPLSAMALTAIVTVPAIIDIVRFNIQNSAAFRVVGGSTPTAPGTERGARRELNGVIVSEATAQHLQSKASALMTHGAVEGPMFLTLHSYLIPKLAHLSSRLPIGDLVGETLNRKDYEHLVDYVKTSNAPEIYVDSIGSDAGEGWPSSQYIDFYRMFLHDVQGGYRRDQVAGGWELWKKNDTTQREALHR
jgi:hypothetical protein